MEKQIIYILLSKPHTSKKQNQFPFLSILKSNKTHGEVYVYPQPGLTLINKPWTNQQKRETGWNSNYFLRRVTTLTY